MLTWQMLYTSPLGALSQSGAACLGEEEGCSRACNIGADYNIVRKKIIPASI
jgi:hypothetical protein